jgi:hypothetical protein
MPKPGGVQVGVARHQDDVARILVSGVALSAKNEISMGAFIDI